MKKIFAAIGLILVLQNAWAIDLHSAKAQGLVGEANSGYLAAVKKPVSNEIKALIADVNAKRKAKFQNTARQECTIALVKFLFIDIRLDNKFTCKYYKDLLVWMAVRRRSMPCRLDEMLD